MLILKIYQNNHSNMKRFTLFKYIFYLVCIALIFPSFNLFSKVQTHTISGNVVDANTNKGIPSVTIRLDKTGFGTFTNKTGDFVIKKVPTGKYLLIASIVGYEPKSIVIDKIDTNLSINISLNPTVFKTEEIIVSANRRLQNIQEVTNSSIVLNKKELLENSQLSFEQALKNVPGLEVYDENVSIRGSDGFDFGLGTRTLMMFDGIPLLSADNGDMKFDVVPISEIERIEIIKGAGSALYGTSAIGGIINLVSKNIMNEGRAFYSSFHGFYTKPRYQSWVFSNNPTTKNTFQLGYSKSIKNFAFSVSGNANIDQGYRKYDDSKQFGGYGKFKYTLSDLNDLSLILVHNSTNNADWVYWNSLDSATIPPANSNQNIRLQSNKTLAALIFNQIISKSSFLSFKTSLFYTDFYNTYNKNESDYRQSKAFINFYDLQFTTNFNDFTLTSGINASINNVNSISYGQRNQQIYALYSQIESHLTKDFITILGFRYDYEKVVNANNNSEFSPKLGFNYKINTDLHLRASVGKGFRSPTISERFASITYQGFKVIENLDLKPETSLSTELGINFRNEDWLFPFELDGAIFYNNLKNLIEPSFTNENYSVIQFSNLTNAQIIGTEVSLKTFLYKNLLMQISSTYIDPQDLTLNQVLKYRSKVNSQLSINYNFEPFNLFLSYRYVSKVVNIDEKIILQVKDADARVPIQVVDLSFGMDLQKYLNTKLKLNLNAYNLLDYYYTYMSGNLAPTRLIGISVNWEY